MTSRTPIIQRGTMADTRDKGLQDYRKKLLEHKEIDGRLKECKLIYSFLINVAEIGAGLSFGSVAVYWNG